MLYPAERTVYRLVAGSYVPLPDTKAAPISDWPSNTPIGISRFLLGRWKSAGGGTCSCVGEPGCAHRGTTNFGFAGACVACESERCGATHSNRTIREGSSACFAEERGTESAMAKNFNRVRAMRPHLIHSTHNSW